MRTALVLLAATAFTASVCAPASAQAGSTAASGPPVVNVPLPKPRKGPTAAEKRQIKNDYKTAKAKCRNEVGADRMACYKEADERRTAALNKDAPPVAPEGPMTPSPPTPR